MRFKSFMFFILIAVFSITVTPKAKANEVVAVAAGISPCVQEIMDLYVAKGGAPLSMVTGPCGALAKQAEAGAPYDLVMMSEPRWPNWMKEKDLLTDVHTFAIGQLVLWSDRGEKPTMDGIKDHITAVPDPEMTAYGMLTKNYLSSKKLWESFASGEIVTTKSAPQAIMAVSSGAAQWAFVPKSSALKAGGPFLTLEGATMDQVGGLGPNAGPDARAFWEFCRSKDIDHVWERWGFHLVNQL